MNVIIMATLSFLVASTTEAKHKSDSTDVSNEDSQQDLSMSDDSSVDATDYPDDVKRDHVHKHKDKGKNHFETRRWHKSCLKRASKLCTKACEKAYKSVCRKRKCSKRSKKALKRECKRSCTNNFEFDKDRAAYEE